jgi:hypothetical protein
MANPNLPIPSNATCDIYHVGNGPPSPPNAAGVPCVLIPYSRNIKPAATVPGQYTHLLRVPAATDVRDTGNFAGPDTVYIPDKNGTPFLVIWVARQGRGTALDHKEVVLLRQNPTYPTNDV